MAEGYGCGAEGRETAVEEWKLRRVEEKKSRRGSNGRASRDMESWEASSEEEGAKGHRSPTKGGPSAPGKSGRKKSRKKKKKAASRDRGAEKSPDKAKKQAALAKPSFEATHPESVDRRRPGAAKAAPGPAAGHPLPASAVSFLATREEDSFAPSDESLRWDGTLEDPVAEEERLWNYRLQRRKRYGDYLRRNQPPEPSFALRNLAELGPFAPTNGESSLGRSESPSSASEVGQSESRLEFSDPVVRLSQYSVL